MFYLGEVSESGARFSSLAPDRSSFFMPEIWSPPHAEIKRDQYLKTLPELCYRELAGWGSVIKVDFDT